MVCFVTVFFKFYQKCDNITEAYCVSWYSKHIKLAYTGFNGEMEEVMASIKITKHNFDQEVLNSKEPVLLDFWATWCGPCRMVAPTVEEIANEMEGTAKVGKINVDEESELASKYRVMSIPTLMVVKDGKISATSVGVKPKKDILSMLEV
jgi:thioredoxin 1